MKGRERVPPIMVRTCCSVLYCTVLYCTVLYCTVPDAEGGAEYEGQGEGAPDHGEDVLQPEEEAEVPGRGVRDGVGDADPSPLLLLRAVKQPSRRFTVPREGPN